MLHLKNKKINVRIVFQVVEDTWKLNITVKHLIIVGQVINK